MQRSTERILTAHAGSLPRPPELVRLYAGRAAGEAIDPAAPEAAGWDALRRVVPQQIAADIGNDGEQQREGFFLHVQHRMSGFGGRCQRPERGDGARYPSFQRMMEAQQAGRTAVSNFQPPEAIGPVRHLGPAATLAECAALQAGLNATEGGSSSPS